MDMMKTYFLASHLVNHIWWNQYWNFYDEHSNDLHDGSLWKPTDGKGVLINETKVDLVEINGALTLGKNIIPRFLAALFQDLCDIICTHIQMRVEL